MTTTDNGRRAEQAAADYLTKQGYRVIDRNWTVPKLCEIDIIAFKDQRVYFVEVKYRLRSLTGGGLAAITALKLRHMRRAAQIWVRQQGFAGGYDLAAIEVGGADFAIGDFIASIY